MLKKVTAKDLIPLALVGRVHVFTAEKRGLMMAGREEKPGEAELHAGAGPRA